MRRSSKSRQQHRSAPAAQPEEIRPQDGPQTQFLASSADIAIYGGAAGGGKTWAELLEPLRHVNNPDFGAVIFRRTYRQVTQEGGLWDQSEKIYPLLGATANQSDHTWMFPSGARIGFAHMQLEKNRLDWQGSEIPLIEFDELTHFSESMFFYMLSRNRSTSGVQPYMRATCNPDADSWVAKFISWWINDKTGLAIPERSGVVRWFVRRDDLIVWADSRGELVQKFGAETLPKSVTFIHSSVYDNRILLAKDPGYLANLKALPLLEQQQLLLGNWKVRPEAGKVFNRAWFGIVDAVPPGGEECRFWDFAATEKSLKKPDPDFTAGVKIRKVNGVYYVLDCIAEQIGPAGLDTLFVNTAKQDAAIALATGTRYRVRWEEEPGSASIRETRRLAMMLDGLDAGGVDAKGDKLTRARGLAAQAQPPVSNVKLLRGEWNEAWLTHMHHQPQWTHDDIMDASSGAHNELAAGGRASAEWI